MCIYHQQPEKHKCEAVDWYGIKLKEYEELQKHYEEVHKNYLEEKARETKAIAIKSIFSVLSLIIVVSLLFYLFIAMIKLNLLFTFLAVALLGMVILFFIGMILSNDRPIKAFFTVFAWTLLLSLIIVFFMVMINPNKNMSNYNQISIPQAYRNGLNTELIAKLIFQYTNQERAQYNLSWLQQDSNLDAVATWQSECLGASGILNHTSSQCGSLTDRFNQFNITDAGGENLALDWDALSYYEGNGDPVSLDSEDTIAHRIVDGWMNSPGHKANILNGTYTYLGVGVWYGTNHKIIATQNFIAKSVCGGVGEPCCHSGVNTYSCYKPWNCSRSYTFTVCE
jgi:uncharacterized protein YkwD